MCGIAGVRSFDGTPITGEMVCSLLLGIEHRGKDATGIAIMDADGEIHIHKKDDPAWRFVTAKDTQTFLDDHLRDASMVLLHTRAATQGSPLHNVNNHPVFAGNAAIIHNGVVHNERVLYNEWKAEQKAEVDSDIFRAAFDMGIDRSLYKRLGEVRGSAAVAAFTKEDPTKLFLMRSGSPIVLGANSSLLMWASTQQALFKSFDQWTEVHGLTLHRRGGPEMHWGVMPDDTGWVIGPGGKEHHFPFRTLMGTYTKPSYSRQETGFKERKEKWLREQAREEAQKKVTTLPAEEETQEIVPLRTPLILLPGVGLNEQNLNSTLPATAVDDGFFARCPLCEGISEVPPWIAAKITGLKDLCCGQEACGCNLAATAAEVETFREKRRALLT